MVEQAKPFKVIAFSGSLRVKSTNKGALFAAAELAPANLSVEVIDYEDIPIYNGDTEATGIPESVTRLYNQIAGADGVLLGCPEYNYSISSALKNAIDWVSRIQPQPFDKKPIAIISSTAGPSGGARS